MACANTSRVAVSVRHSASARASTRDTATLIELSSTRFARGDVRIFAERGGISVGENLDHPAIEVIHRMIHDGFESAVVLAMGFLNVFFQSNAEISVLATSLTCSGHNILMSCIEILASRQSPRSVTGCTRTRHAVLMSIFLIFALAFLHHPLRPLRLLGGALILALIMRLTSRMTFWTARVERTAVPR